MKKSKVTKKKTKTVVKKIPVDLLVKIMNLWSQEKDKPGYVGLSLYYDYGSYSIVPLEDWGVDGNKTLIELENEEAYSLNKGEYVNNNSYGGYKPRAIFDLKLDVIENTLKKLKVF